VKKYFISYYFTKKNGAQGHGSGGITRGPITSYDEVQGIAAAFREKLCLKEVVILNWRPFEEVQS
jgi:hypothetical protein